MTAGCCIRHAGRDSCVIIKVVRAVLRNLVLSPGSGTLPVTRRASCSVPAARGPRGRTG
jgi:hypothetical protein